MGYCTFCGLYIYKSFITSHYRKCHKDTDIGMVRKSKPKTDSCIICFKNHNTLLLPCKHTSTCFDCLQKWWQHTYYGPKCPICRSKVRDISPYL
jgi:hypothetical protein